MNKADLVYAVLKTLGNGHSRAAAERSVDAVIDAIRLGLKKDRTVQLVGFGTFKVTERKARTGREPEDGRQDQDQGFEVGEIFCWQRSQGQDR